MRAQRLITSRLIGLVALTMPMGNALGRHRQDPRRADAQQTFANVCAECHGESQSGRTPSRYSLSQLSPRAIVEALENGVMKTEGGSLSREQRIGVAELLTSRSYASTPFPAQAWCAQRGAGATQPQGRLVDGIRRRAGQHGLPERRARGARRDRCAEAHAANGRSPFPMPCRCAPTPPWWVM